MKFSFWPFADPFHFSNSHFLPSGTTSTFQGPSKVLEGWVLQGLNPQPPNQNPTKQQQPGVSKECFLEAKYLKTSKQHLFETPGTSIHRGYFLLLSALKLCQSLQRQQRHVVLMADDVLSFAEAAQETFFFFFSGLVWFGGWWLGFGLYCFGL